MPELPLTISFERVTEALASLGIPVEHAVSVHFGVHSIEVEETRVDSSGRSVGGDGGLATVITTIPYDRGDA